MRSRRSARRRPLHHLPDLRLAGRASSTRWPRSCSCSGEFGARRVGSREPRRAREPARRLPGRRADVRGAPRRLPRAHLDGAARRERRGRGGSAAGCRRGRPAWPGSADGSPRPACCAPDSAPRTPPTCSGSSRASTASTCSTRAAVSPGRGRRRADDDGRAQPLPLRAETRHEGAQDAGAAARAALCAIGANEGVIDGVAPECLRCDGLRVHAPTVRAHPPVAKSGRTGWD